MQHRIGEWSDPFGERHRVGIGGPAKRVSITGMRSRLCFLILACCLAVCMAWGAQAQDSRWFTSIHSVAVCDGRSEQPPSFAGCPQSELYRVDPQGGLIWIDAEVDLPQAIFDAEIPVVLRMGALASSEVYWNGELIGSNGKPGASAQAEIPGKLDAGFFVPRRLLVPGANRVTLRLSSHHSPVRVGTPVHYLYAAEARPLVGTSRYLAALLTAGAFAFAAVYFGVLGATDRDRSGALLIALMALFAGGQLLAESLRDLLDLDYPLQVWRLITIALCAAGFSLSMTAYLVRRFQPRNWKPWLACAAVGAAAAMLEQSFDGKALLALFIPSVVALAALWRPAVSGQPGARVAAGSLLLFVVLLVLDRQLFLDRTFYLAAAAMTLVLLIDQARSVRQIKAARERLQVRAERLELEILRRKIAPHFLMNTLNALVEWVESDPKTGVAMIEALADEFRLLSQMSHKTLVPLAEEIQLCRRHLEVMSYRVDQAFSLETHDLDETMKIPPGVIHTLIENGFTHGKLADGGVFEVRQSQADATTTLTVVTPPAVSPAPARSIGGEGLDYVRKRLASAFGEAVGFSDGPSDQGGWRSILSFAREAS